MRMVNKPPRNPGIRKPKQDPGPGRQVRQAKDNTKICKWERTIADCVLIPCLGRNVMALMHGTGYNNNWKHCPYCGKTLQITTGDTAK